MIKFITETIEEVMATLLLIWYVVIYTIILITESLIKMMSVKEPIESINIINKMKFRFNKCFKENYEIRFRMAIKILLSIIICFSIKILLNRDEFSEYSKAIRMRESSNNYQAINKYGYKGAYQFGWKALKDLNIKADSLFLNNKNIQDSCFKEYTIMNAYRLRHYRKYDGKTINGIEISFSGILAAAHLVGAGNVKIYLKSNGKKIAKDANGTSLEEYIKLFHNYKLNLNYEETYK